MTMILRNNNVIYACFFRRRQAMDSLTMHWKPHYGLRTRSNFFPSLFYLPFGNLCIFSFFLVWHDLEWGG